MSRLVVGQVLVLLFVLATGLALLSWVKLRSRLRAHVERGTVLDDEDVKRIVETGTYSSDEDEPLDLERAREEEKRFWDEAEWDEAEEW